MTRDEVIAAIQSYRMHEGCTAEFAAGVRSHTQHLLAALPEDEPAPLRPEVLAFAQAMEAKLREHDGDRGAAGWRRDSTSALLRRLREEVEELALVGPFTCVDEVLGEAADVGNFAMMIADVCGVLRAPAPSAPMTTPQRYCNKCGAIYSGGPVHAGCVYHAAIVHHHNAPPADEGTDE